MKTALFLSIFFLSLQAEAQDYQQQIRNWQQWYKGDFLTDTRSPLKAKDTGYLRFFPISERWNVSINVMLTPEAKPVAMGTHSGKIKSYRPYATISWQEKMASGENQILSLIAYERIDAPAGDTSAANSLFLPFNDLSNGSETYGGGRYIDLLKSELRPASGLTGTAKLDFNKAYNPWCAFAGGYSCPIPPVENRLDYYIGAGEKLPAPPLLPKD